MATEDKNRCCSSAFHSEVGFLLPPFFGVTTDNFFKKEYPVPVAKLGENSELLLRSLAGSAL